MIERFISGKYLGEKVNVKESRDIESIPGVWEVLDQALKVESMRKKNGKGEVGEARRETKRLAGMEGEFFANGSERDKNIFQLYQYYKKVRPEWRKGRRVELTRREYKLFRMGMSTMSDEEIDLASFRASFGFRAFPWDER